jgi:hypothetical protein
MLSKIQTILQSRKFWAAIIAALASVAAYFSNEITTWQLIQSLVMVAAAYSTGVAIEDAGYGIGRRASHE